MSLVDVLPELAALLVAAGAEDVVLETFAVTDVVAALVVALVVETLVMEALVDAIAEDEDDAEWVAFEDDVEVVAGDELELFFVTGAELDTIAEEEEDGTATTEVEVV